MKRSKRGRFRRLAGRGILIILLVGMIVWTYRSTWLTRGLEFAVAQPGTIKHEQTVRATFANEESLIQAPLGGRVHYIGEEGQRLRRGETLLRVEAEGAVPGAAAQPAPTVEVAAPAGGLFYQSVDGLESIYTPNNFLAMDLNKLLDTPGIPTEPQEVVQAGATVGKIVNNLEPTVGFVELQDVSELELGQTLRFTIDGQRQNGKIIRKSENPRGVVVSFTQFVNSSVGERQQEITWHVSPDVNGVVVPQSALYTQGEEIGVYLVVEGVLHFRPVAIIDQDEQQVCVGNLPSGISVVQNPRPGLEGIPVQVKNP